MRWAPVAALACGLSAWCTPTPAGAAEPSPVPQHVRLSLPACDELPFTRASLLAVLQVELRSDGVETVDSTDRDRDRDREDGVVGTLAKIALSVPSCGEAEHEVTIRIEDSVTRKSLSRTVDVGDAMPVARARTVALAVAELLRASWLELAMPGAPVPAAGVSVPAPVRRAVDTRLATLIGTSSPAASSVDAFAAFELRLLPAASLDMIGARIGASASIGSIVRVAIDGGALRGRSRDSLGDVTTTLAQGGLAALVRGGSSALRVELGPRLELGYAWTEGSAFDARTSSSEGQALVLLATLEAVATARLSGHWLATVGVEGGRTLRGLDALADGRHTGGVTGAVFVAKLGLGYYGL